MLSVGEARDLVKDGGLTIDRLDWNHRRSMTSPLLIVWHSRTGACEALARSAADGAGSAAKLLRAGAVTAEDVLAARGYLFCGPENLAALSGEMKEMFDRLYYLALGRIEGRAYATIITAGSDGTGAQRQLDRIATGWRLKRVADPMIVNTRSQTPEEILASKTINRNALERAREIGLALTEGLTAGIF